MSDIQHFLNHLEYRQTGKDPKANGFHYAEVPDWQLRQWAEQLEQPWQPISEVPPEIKEAGMPLIGGTREPKLSAIVSWINLPTVIWIIENGIGCDSEDYPPDWQPTHFQLLPDPSEIPEVGI